MTYPRITKARAKGERVAALLLDRIGSIALPIPIKEIAISEGCAIRSAALEDDLSGMAFIKEGQKHIVYNALHHINRQRFTIAHELGHHLMDATVLRTSVHVDKGTLRRDNFSSDGIDEMEIAANAFAASVLMPENLVREMCPRSLDLEDDRAVYRLAKLFAVSQAAFTNRILNLSLG
ncbi:ImmA/IrrE family metallo-endopeptidase [Qipengyuania sp. MTN3-11]|uniref:ImmA/IrrE family metallo-endopeptidase n=1 Tax=Qipengyuania sp. MTN3-11 TaxID=3056557 RepID=UPI0036F3F92C